jgi:peptidyl-prolyl cis-trans isomerase B (cyclophilin B)
MTESQESVGEIMAVIATAKGEIRVRLFPNEAPQTVANFVNLAQRGYFDGLKFHRVIPDFMIQGGDPTGTGRGGPGYQFRDEFHNNLKHDGPGTLSMANAGPNSNGSQFFITHTATPWLDRKHSVFGKVVSGQSTVNAIQQGDAMLSIAVEGDVAGLLEKQDKNVAKWNKTLDQQFPDKKAASASAN